MAPRSIAISAEAACIRINRLRHELHMIEAGFAADTPSPERGLALGVPEIDAQYVTAGSKATVRVGGKGGTSSDGYG